MSQYWGYRPEGLSDKLNWDLAYRGDRRSSTAPNTGAHIPIPPLSLALDSPVLLIGCKSNESKPSWYLGGYASMRLFYSPSVTSEFPASCKEASQDLELGVLNRINWPLVEATPYLLLVKAPRYFHHLFLEVWTFSGGYDDLHTLTP